MQPPVGLLKRVPRIGRSRPAPEYEAEIAEDCHEAVFSGPTLMLSKYFDERKRLVGVQGQPTIMIVFSKGKIRG